MEAVSLGIGVVGLAALFDSCMNAAERVSSYRSSETDSGDLEAQFAADRLRFDQWGRNTGIYQQGLSSQTDCHPALADKQTYNVVHGLLSTLQRHLRASNDQKLPADATDDAGRRTPTSSKRWKASWSLWNKKKRVHEVATFGTFVQKLYEVIPVEENDVNASIKAYSAPWLDDLQKVTEQLERQMLSETKRDIQSWLLGRYDATDIYDEVVQDRLEGTCNWILDSISFQGWCRGADTDPRTLWINAPAGFGKTVLAARIIEYLQESFQGPVVHFFFSAALDTREDPLSAIRSWLAQIISHGSEAFDLMRQEYATQETKHAKRTSLGNLLQQVVHCTPNCTLVVDGLDECTTRSEVTSFLELVEEAIEGTSTRLLAISRDVTEIRSGFKLSFAEIKITPENVRDDVQSYSQSVIEKKLPNKSGDIKSNISSRMADRCEGQFLWVKIQATSLKKSFNQKQLQKSIEEAPVGLDRLYERDWAEIQRKNKRDITRATSLLQWATFALRPLSVYEMVEAVLLRTDTDDFPEDELPDDIDQDYINEEILGLCGSLIEVRRTTNKDIGSSRIHLPHFTVKQFLLVSLPSLHIEPAPQSSYECWANLCLGEMCLRYILNPYSWRDKSNDRQTRLYQYAAVSWSRHCLLGEWGTEPYDAKFLKLTSALFHESHPSWHPWRRCFELARGARKFVDEPVLANPLFFACSLNLQSTAAHIVRTDSSSIHHTSSHKRNALLPCAAKGRTTLVKLLLDAGSTPNMTNGDGNTPLGLAAGEGRDEVVKLLIERGADITARNSSGMTALYIATIYGYNQTVQLLLSEGAEADIDSQKEGGWTALNAAAEKGNVGIVRLLLDSGANIALPTDSGQTPLHTASLQSRLEIVQLLLERGADVSAKARDGYTPLHVASEKQYIEVATLLLDRGADVNLANDRGFTPLYMACLKGHLQLAQTLLARGADPSREHPGNGYTPLHAAIDKRNTEVAKLLLDRGADFTLPNNLGMTPLYTACLKGCLEVAQRLLTMGADLSKSKDGGLTPLHAAAARGSPDIVKLLLGHGADMMLVNSDGITPFYMACLNGRLHAAQILLAAGADVSKVKHGGYTPLHAAVEKGHKGMVKFLVAHGADITVPADDALTPLHLACRNGHLEIARLLLEKGADISATLKRKWTLLNAVAFRGDEKVAKFLIEHGADITAPNEMGSTPLHSASFSGSTGIIRILLDKGVSVNPTNESGCTPLREAIIKRRKDAVMLLLVKGADPTITGVDGRDGLVIAAHVGYAALVEDLLGWYRGNQTSADDVVDKFGRSPLFAAARGGQLEVVRLLLRAFPGMAAVKDWRNITPLSAAARNGRLETVQVLLAREPNLVDEKDAYNRTAYDWASRNEDEPMKRLLSASREGTCSQTDLLFSDETTKFLGRGAANPGAGFCDTCEMDFCSNSKYYTCISCCSGAIAICADCKDWGETCMDSSHQMEVVDIPPVEVKS